MKTEFVLEDFEGPLDLLWTLIEEEKIDILDIPIAEITSQYNEIIDSWSVYKLEEVSEYLLMAARLIQIKSKMLLPRPSRHQELADPRLELTNQLLEYKAIREIASFIKESESEYSRVYTKDPEYFAQSLFDSLPKISVIDLERALRRVMQRGERKARPKLSVQQDRFSIHTQLEYIEEQLKSLSQISFRELLSSSADIEEIVVTFLAVLELYKIGRADFELDQKEIYLFRR